MSIHSGLTDFKFFYEASNLREGGKEESSIKRSQLYTHTHKQLVQLMKMIWVYNPFDIPKQAIKYLSKQYNAKAS